jgi:hypothetical protein
LPERFIFRRKTHHRRRAGAEGDEAAAADSFPDSNEQLEIRRK